MTPLSRPWVSVVIPIKDERENLLPLTEQLIMVLRSQKESLASPFEILFIDDGSTDGSGPILDDLATRNSEIQVRHFDRNYGKTSALDAGFRHASAELIVTMDGDLQHDPTDMPKLISQSDRFDVVCGWRKDRRDNLVRRLSSRLAYLLRRLVTGDEIHDAGCSLMVFRRAAAERMTLYEGMHRFLPALARMHGFSVTEVPVRHYPRRFGESKYGIRNRFFRGFCDLLAVRWMQARQLRYRLKERGSD